MTSGTEAAFADLLRRALAFQQSGNLADAELLYREVLRRNPDLADAVHMLGVIHLQAGNYAEALRRLHRAAELFDWQFPAVRHNLGLAIAALLFGRNDAQVERLWAAYDDWRDRLGSSRRDGNPLVSVIAVNFSDAHRVEDLLESVYGQSYAQIELVVVDDGSVEGLRSKLARSPHRWQVRARGDREDAAAINDAITHSRGEFVNLLVGDDRFAATRVETMVEGIARAGAAWGFSRAGLVVEPDATDRGRKVASRASELAYIADDIAARDTVGMSFLSGNAAMSMTALFFARSLFDELGGFRESSPCYDWDFCLRASIIAEPVYVASAEYEHRLHGDDGGRQPAEAGRRAAEATLAAFYDSVVATRSPANPFAPVPAVWGERFFAQLLGSGRAATSLPAPVLRDLAVRAAAICGPAPG